eukprot:TRINITY_DN9324_c0_g1_i1.p1 TRINITY_DN9324_c0_g1~~TRINITY_DN9324_c0_g1_i1.p1  ORF type:complete len:218 (+),score=64.27 TRINITY_DN9324_c0_g1_i1:92-655(+)
MEESGDFCEFVNPYRSQIIHPKVQEEIMERVGVPRENNLKKSLEEKFQSVDEEFDEFIAKDHKSRTTSTLEGILQMKSGWKKSLKPRWFAFNRDQGQLLYWLSGDKSKKPKGVIDLKLLQKVIKEKHGGGFVIQTAKKNYRLVASTGLERDIWVDVLSKLASRFSQFDVEQKDFEDVMLQAKDSKKP